MPKLRRKKHAETQYELNESDKLVLFLHRMTDLVNRKYYKDFKCSISPEVIACTNVDEDLFMAFLVAFRHFYATNEPTEIGKIHNVLKYGATKLRDDAMLRELEAIKDGFAKAPVFVLNVHDEHGITVKQIRGAQIMDLYLNSRYFHTDVRGLQFFFQLKEADLRQSRDIFQMSLVPYVERLKAYVPIAVRILQSKVLPHGRASIPNLGVTQFATARRGDGRSPAARGININLPVSMLPDDLRTALLGAAAANRIDDPTRR